MIDPQNSKFPPMEVPLPDWEPVVHNILLRTFKPKINYVKMCVLSRQSKIKTPKNKSCGKLAKNTTFDPRHAVVEDPLGLSPAF